MARKNYKNDVLAIVTKLNQLSGLADDTYVMNESTGRYQSIVGVWHISSAYGGHQLHRMGNAAGGITSHTSGYVSWRELLPKVQAIYMGQLESRVSGRPEAA